MRCTLESAQYAISMNIVQPIEIVLTKNNNKNKDERGE